MLDHYLDIRVLPDPEFQQSMLLGALVSKLHRGLVGIDADDIGISFPAHQTDPRTLGDVLRLHGTADRLHELTGLRWLTGMRDHVDRGGIRAVPDGAAHRVVRRRQYKTSAERLRRRRMRRHDETYEQACAQVPDSVERQVTTPFVTVRSSSTGRAFSLFIEHGDCGPDPVPGAFSTYGLSRTATVPWF
ncbi:type I-F CRISPR-associated endoribonuclease Cas6/Csy4 [Arhodomonas aquaeolei]|uniref:type I-F CRISPR-associated endoribonuclease Cas6/Csy4 n=1 Tax=Arhodomonas aquaeolei TaxID=2369 RepID=UPI0003677BD0|nr:type I-F CRISPR-associated endoribonuclease Cas6/Csy4 [Arhodomonas aquaeolei]